MEKPVHIHHRAVFSDLAPLDAPCVLELQGDEARHLARVRRARAHESIELIDTLGRVATGRIESIRGSKQRPELEISVTKIVERIPVSPELSVCAPPPKGDKLDRMIDQLTQLGVASYRPLVCARSERDPERIRWDRISRIVDEACKQCGRAHALTIQDPIELADAIELDRVLVCDASGDAPLSATAQDLSVLIGPEGGWSDEERSLFGSKGVGVRTLGVHVLRIEAAAPAAAALALASAQPEQTRA